MGAVPCARVEEVPGTGRAAGTGAQPAASAGKAQSVRRHPLGYRSALLDHAVPVCQFAIEDVAEDLGVAMRMGRKARATCDSVFVENSQTPEVLELGIVVACEGERVV